MSTIKTINVTHPSSATNNIVTDSSGNVSVGGSLTVGGVAAVAVAPGTSGNVLTSNGSAWTSATAPVINTQTFDSSGTWTKPAGYASTSRVLVQAWGAGGSGGRNTTATSCSGGGGGGYIERWLNLSQLGATETITVGAGGAARTGSNQAGAAGGNTTVGSLVTAYAGGGGTSSVNATGGGGGGQLSAGDSGASAVVTTNPGRPYIAVQDSDGTGGAAGNPRQGAGCSTTVSNDGVSMSALTHGGGGGASATNLNAASSVYGGGGGGGASTGTGGTSLFGGNGGAAGTTTGGSGVQPGGAGGSATGTSGAGAAGRVIITIFPA